MSLKVLLARSVWSGNASPSEVSWVLRQDRSDGPAFRRLLAEAGLANRVASKLVAWPQVALAPSHSSLYGW